MAGMGCGLSLAAGALAVYGVCLLLGGPAWPLAVLAFAAAGVTVMVKVSGLAEYRSRRQRAELRRRHEPQDFDAEVRETEAGVKDQPGIDWILLLRGHGLPHGRIRDQNRTPAGRAAGRLRQRSHGRWH